MTNLANAQSLFFSALQAQEKLDLDTAERLYREALTLAPGRPSIVNNLAAVLFQQNKFEDACALCMQHLKSAPGEVSFWIQLGNARLGMRQFEQALESFTAAMRCAPDHPEALANTAYVMDRLGRPQDALKHLDRLIELAPDHVVALNNRGNVFTKLNRFDEALRDYQRAQRIAPVAPMSYWNESLCRLLLGDFERGWKLYGWGWEAGQRGMAKPDFSQPAWNGIDDVGTLMAWGEQGIGDQILFASMLDDLRGRAKHIVVAVEHRLLPLFRRSFPDFTLVDLKTAASQSGIDRQIALGDLGMHLRRNWQDFPKNRKSFLHPDRTRSQALRKRMGDDGALLCGFSWSSTNPSTGQFKSLTEADLSALGAIKNVRWIDLQYGDTNADRSRFARQFGLEVTHLDDIDNFADIEGLAALIAACDLVVSVSNTTVHLAGALGVPTLVMLPHAVGRIWYWHPNAANSPWYPSCQLIRQSSPGDWTSVIAAVASTVREHADQRTKNCSAEEP